MKKIAQALTFIALLVTFTGCLKEKHSVRFENNFSQRIDNVVIGNASFGSVNPGVTTEYKPINTGNFTISGTGANGGQLSGSGTISGKGTHKWTVTLSSSGGVSIAEDKK
jgi:hypothetical protein